MMVLSFLLLCLFPRLPPSITVTAPFWCLFRLWHMFCGFSRRYADACGPRFLVSNGVHTGTTILGRHLVLFFLAVPGLFFFSLVYAPRSRNVFFLGFFHALSPNSLLPTHAERGHNVHLLAFLLLRGSASSAPNILGSRV